MKIWCFLCFGEEEEDNKVYCERRGRFGISMSEGILGNVIEGGVDDMENDQPEVGFGLGLTSWGGINEVEEGLGSGEKSLVAERSRDGLENEGLFNMVGNQDGGEGGVKVGNSLGFDQLESSSCQEMTEVNLQLALSDEPSSSLLSAALDWENCEHDLQNKRPKVHSFSLDWDTEFENEICYLPPMYKDNDIGNQSGFDGNINDEENDTSTSKVEDLDVRMDLTDDLLHMVFSFLDHIHLCRASRVCRQWRAASSHEDFWRYLNFENRRITTAQFDEMCQRYPNATAVNIYGTPSIHLLVMKAVSSLRNLEVLTLGKGQIGESFFQALPDCHMLKSLTINDTTLGNGIQEIPIYHDRLRVLQIVKCRVLRVSIRCPQLETLSLKRSSMPQVVLNCPLLRDLDIASCHKLSDAAIRSAATSCPLLESLDMSNCWCVSNKTLRKIAETCGNLHLLDASYCQNISLESVGLPKLTILKLHSCEGITSASMAAISRSYMLEVLELDYCSLLTSVSLDLPRLKSIRLVHCRKFIDLDLRSSTLSSITSITVSNCPSLQRINITSNTLEKLVLQKQESLTTLALQCQCLQEVDLTKCESLTNSICEVFGDGGGCPVLKSLVLDSCESLTTVGFFNSSLISLSLAGCRAITSLQIGCPCLEQVSLYGCNHLERASLCPVGLRSLNLGICRKLKVLHLEAPKMALLELNGCVVLLEASINCPLLTSLDASFCSRLKENCLSATTASCSFIESLILISCRSDGLLSLCWPPNLTYLDLSYTFLVNLQPVFESCARLKVLKLQACVYLTDSSLEPLYKEGALPVLCELDLSYGTICRSAIEELLACCTHLTHVTLNGCITMHDLVWGFGGNEILEKPKTHGFSDANEQPHRLLQNLNCVGCPNIKKVFIPPTAQCFCLSSLNLSLSSNLKEVDLACCNLCFLNLSNCGCLETLKIDCPSLTSLFLQSCNIDEEAVESAITCCSMLETLDVRFCPKISSMSMDRLRAACPSLKRIFSSLVPLKH